MSQAVIENAFWSAMLVMSLTMTSSAVTSALMSDVVFEGHCALRSFWHTASIALAAGVVILATSGPVVSGHH